MNADWDALPGKVTVETLPPTFPDADYSVVRGVHSAGGTYRYGAQIPVSNQLLEDSAVDINGFIVAQFDRVFRPWAYPDRRWSFTFTPFPRWDRFARKVRRLADRVRAIGYGRARGVDL